MLLASLAMIWMFYVGLWLSPAKGFLRLVLHFLPANKPSGASDRCLECVVERSCPYSAPRLYHRLRESGRHGWPLHVVTNDFTEEGVNAALSRGPYGRCVYSCDNDVVDNQVVNLEFDSGRTANFMMTAFSHDDLVRTTRIRTHGEIRGDSGHSVHGLGKKPYCH